MDRLDTSELEEMMEKGGVVLVNTMAPNEFEKAHIPQSINVPALDEDFVERVKEAAPGKDTPIVVYCSKETGDSTRASMERLEGAGFERVYEYPGGTDLWAKHGLELEGLSGDVIVSADEEPDKDERSEEAEEDRPSSEAKEEKAESKDASAGKSKKKKEPKASESKSKKPAKAEKDEEDGAQPIVRHAVAHWEGALKDGHGSMGLGSARGVELSYSYASRFESADTTNPEELLGAALAGCFSMAFAASLGEAGYTPHELETSAKVSLEKADGGFRIAAVRLSTTGRVDAIDESEFIELAENASKNCPVSKVLSNAEIEVEATLMQ